MKDYDGPVYNKQGKRDDSLKQRRFNRLSQQESAKTHFKPALKQRRSLEPTFEFETDPVEGMRSQNNPNISNNHSNDSSLFSKQLEKRSGSFDQQSQRPTPPEDYQVPFLKHHATPRHSLNDALLEGERTKSLTQSLTPNRPVPKAPTTRHERYYEETNLSELEPTTYLDPTARVQTETPMNEKAKFQPTYLPKSTQVEDKAKKNSMAERELARRLVKTQDMFLLFDN